MQVTLTCHNEFSTKLQRKVADILNHRDGPAQVLHVFQSADCKPRRNSNATVAASPTPAAVACIVGCGDWGTSGNTGFCMQAFFNELVSGGVFGYTGDACGPFLGCFKVSNGDNTGTYYQVQNGPEACAS